MGSNTFPCEILNYVMTVKIFRLRVMYRIMVHLCAEKVRGVCHPESLLNSIALSYTKTIYQMSNQHERLWGLQVFKLEKLLRIGRGFHSDDDVFFRCTVCMKTYGVMVFQHVLCLK